MQSLALIGLVSINERQIGAEAVNTVNARDLHAFLGNGEVFATWIKQRILQYGFNENNDFVIYLGVSKKGRPSTEYAISIDMAKELSMVESNENGWLTPGGFCDFTDPFLNLQIHRGNDFCSFLSKSADGRAQ